MQRILVVAVIATLALARAAHAGPAESIPAAQDWWDQLVNSGTLPAPTKKAPLHYGVFPYAAEPCGAFDARRVDKATSKKVFSALSSCLAAATQAEEDPEYLWQPSDVDSLLIGFDHDRKAVKKIRKALRKMEIVSLEVRGREDAAAVHVFFAIDKRGQVRGVYMYVDSAD